MKAKEELTILLLQARSNEARRNVECGRFRNMAELNESQFRCVDIHEDVIDTTLLEGVDGLIIGGSGYSVFDDAPKMDEMTALVTEARRRGIPTLGVCFGSQLLAHAFGGKVIRDTERREVGTYVMKRTVDGSIDAVFADLPAKFAAQCAHQDVIIEVPENALILAKSEKCPVQAFAIPGADIYAVQFHPEITKDEFLRLISEEKNGPPMPGVQYADIDTEELAETPEAASVITKFIERIVVHRTKEIV